jgi:hypothetical protein
MKTTAVFFGQHIATYFAGYIDVCPELSEVRAILRATLCDGGSAEGSPSDVPLPAVAQRFTAQSSVRDGYSRTGLLLEQNSYTFLSLRNNQKP